MVVPATRYRRALNRSVRRAANPESVIRMTEAASAWIGPWSRRLRGQPMLAKHFCSLVHLGRCVPTFQNEITRLSAGADCTSR